MSIPENILSGNLRRDSCLEDDDLDLNLGVEERRLNDLDSDDDVDGDDDDLMDGEEGEPQDHHSHGSHSHSHSNSHGSKGSGSGSVTSYGHTSRTSGNSFTFWKRFQTSQDERYVFVARALFFLMLLAAGIAIGLMFYFISANEEQRDFEDDVSPDLVKLFKTRQSKHCC